MGGGKKTREVIAPSCAIVLQRKLVKTKGAEFFAQGPTGPDWRADGGGALLYAGIPNSAQTSPDKSLASLSGFPKSRLLLKANT